MSDGVSEPVRLRAATEILDRAGIRGGVEIRPLPQEELPAAVLEQRLTMLSQRMSGCALVTAASRGRTQRSW
jgi:hypothetical protein